MGGAINRTMLDENSPVVRCAGELLNRKIEGLCSPPLDCVTTSCLVVATIMADDKQDELSEFVGKKCPDKAEDT